MANKELNARIITKHDKEENWNKATSFIPKLGEIVVYEQDNISSVSRIKIGNGIDRIKDLSFITEPYVLKENGKGLSANDFTDYYEQELNELISKFDGSYYQAGLDIGLDNKKFYNKGLVDIKITPNVNSFTIVKRTGPNEEDIESTEISLDNVAEDVKKDLADSIFSQLPDHIVASSKSGYFNVDKKEILIGGWNTLGDLAFKSLEDISDLAVPEILISDGMVDDYVDSIKLWYRKDDSSLYIKNEDSFKRIVPEKVVIDIQPSDNPGYLTVQDMSGIYEVMVSSGLNFKSNGTSGAYFEFTASSKAGEITRKIYTNGLPLTGGTVTGKVSFTNTTASTSTTTGAITIAGGLGVAGDIYCKTVNGTIANDYAEYRSQLKEIQPGRVAYCDDDGLLKTTVQRLQCFEGVVSDTFGFSIGKNDKNQTPLAVSGRVLVYTDSDKENFHNGDVVCAAPNGTVSRMTREEIVKYPDRIVGIVSEIPNYNYWGSDKIEVNNRIWIRVK